jgi:hypothetical protein
MIRIGEQGKPRIMLVVEFFLRFKLVRTYPNHGDFSSTYLFQCVPHILCLSGSTGGIGFGIKVKKQFFTGEIGNRHILTILII